MKIKKLIYTLATLLIATLLVDYVISPLITMLMSLIIPAPDTPDPNAISAAPIVSYVISGIIAGFIAIIPVWWNMKSDDEDKRDLLNTFPEKTADPALLKEYVRKNKTKKTDTVIFIIAVVIFFGVPCFIPFTNIVSVLLNLISYVAPAIVLDLIVQNKVRTKLYVTWLTERMHVGKTENSESTDLLK